MPRPRKQWSQLKPSTRQRYKAAGIHPNTYNAGKADLRKARGHRETPEHPERAQKHPDRFDKYLARRKKERDDLIARKERIFGGRVKWRPRGSEKALDDASPAIIRKVLKMTDDEIDALVSQAGYYANQKSEELSEYRLLFYH